MAAAATPNPDHIRPLEALRAFRALFRNKEDTAQVFRIIDATAGKSRGAAFRRAQSNAAGRRLLADRPDLLAALSDRDTLKALPPGTLGRAYHDFTYGENLTADGLVAASVEGANYASRGEAQAWFGARMRDQHDLWHVVSGYGREGFGELCLLAFTHAQTKNRGVGLIVLVGMAKWKRLARHMPVIAAIREARRRGLHAAWLAEQRWEDLLARPLNDVRDQLRIPPAPVYDGAFKEARRLEAMVYPQAQAA